MKKLFTTLLILGSLVFATTGCGKMKSAVNASLRLAVQVDQLAKDVERAYDAKAISRETAMNAAEMLQERLVPGVSASIAFVDRLSKA